MLFIVATNVVASWLPELQPTGTPTARAKQTLSYYWESSITWFLGLIDDWWSIDWFFEPDIDWSESSIYPSTFNVS